MHKKILLTVVFTFVCFIAKAQTTFTVFDEILFYDGYAATVNEPVPNGVIRHKNSLYAKKLTQSQLNSLGNTLHLDITLKAACDNYDRLGHVYLSFVPTGTQTYDPSQVMRIEVARIITPFMNKNVSPTEVPYEFNLNNVVEILKDSNLTSQYDIWVEFEVFGVPYAAQNEVAGCAGRIDTFYGTLEFTSTQNANMPDYADDNFLLALSCREDLNNYNATDVQGETTRILDFNLTETIENANLYLITSNHGANTGGEEYNRRNHFVYLDDNQIHMYKPGGESCEPYRIYNTQPNCIYLRCDLQGYPNRNDWSDSNWCPGDKIPIRVINLGTLQAGDHTIKLDVPDAVFVNQEGYIPVSAYIQNRDQVLSLSNVNTISLNLFPNPTQGDLTIESKTPITSVIIYNLNGKKIWSGSGNNINISSLPTGLYLAEIQTSEGKIIKKVSKK
ncbi:peptide-N-glycosidase F-related protein [Mesonia maritima]|uniref:Peptide-N-glycosidase F N-terminal domain-containing protein n=1 Tax=Mesonia maritima TaxID=1793873 RepID=A0ABU1K457_9FLAO|nr:peptide-N-glycosidase F-related protein [Mesonia maritima]MDR6300404.1 hypothetical protein [Mesonia maritima]